MEKMVFKTFVFPNNPHTYQEACSREGVYEKNDDGEEVFQELGPVKRVISGEGVFFGETAFDDFRSLAKLAEESTPGNLQHPVWGIRYCYLTELELTQEARENCVSYRFTFQQADSSGAIPK